MQKYKILKWTLGVFLLLIFLAFILPNIFNVREKEAFSDEARIGYARENYLIDSIGDSIVVQAGSFYKRKGLHIALFGEKYRALWETPVKVKVLNFSEKDGGLKGEKLGGGMQTIGMDLHNNDGKAYDLRSVNKDQSKALPSWLQYSYARFMFRDQVAALNPYASVVIPSLAEAAGMMHTYPELVFVPYDPGMGKEYVQQMAGRLAILEERPNESWTNTARFNHAIEIMGTEEMFEMATEKSIAIDTLLFLRCRLFDILISDWDRHEGQWEWALVNDGGVSKFQPIPKDRDMAFYKFNEGYLSFLALQINPKFQSFTKNYENVAGLTVNSRELDHTILGSLEKAAFITEANALQSRLTDKVIREAFSNYPPEIFALVGDEHIEILQARRDQLKEAASAFYEVLKDQ